VLRVKVNARSCRFLDWLFLRATAAFYFAGIWFAYADPFLSRVLAAALLYSPLPAHGFVGATFIYTWFACPACRLDCHLPCTCWFSYYHYCYS